MGTPLKAARQNAGRVSAWCEHREVGPLAGIAEATWTGAGGWPRQIRHLPDGCADIVWDGERLTVFFPAAVAVWRPIAAEAHDAGLRLRCGVQGILFGPTPS